MGLFVVPGDNLFDYLILIFGHKSSISRFYLVDMHFASTPEEVNRDS